MIKSIGKLTLATILAALVIGVPLTSSAQTTPTPAPAPAVPSKPRAIPFHGKVAAVDKAANTITLEGKTQRTFEVASSTKITKGKDRTPATLDDAVVGEKVSGSYLKSEDGKMTLRVLRLDPKSEATK